MSAPLPIPGFRPVPFTGVIFVMAEAGRLGFRYGHPDWCNLGQGQPETGPLPGAPPRVHQVEIGRGRPGLRAGPGHLGAAPRGRGALQPALPRAACARSTPSATSASAAAGASSLTRAVAALGQVNLGHFLPDYTAYEELLDIFKLFTSIPILLDGREGYHFSPEHLREEITGRGLSALLLSNPCNPTGRVIADEELARLGRRRARARLHAADRRVLLALHLARDGRRRRSRLRGALRGGRRHRSRRALRRPDQELALSGLALQLDRRAAAGDRGGLEQRLVPRRRRQQAAAALGGAAARARRSWRPRRRRSARRSCGSATLMVEGLRRGGRAVRSGAGGDVLLVGRRLRRCRPAINDGMSFFRAALERKVICVPGEFFDVNPGKRRSGRPSRFRHYVRFSFGPEEATVAEGVRRIRGDGAG